MRERPALGFLFASLLALVPHRVSGQSIMEFTLPGGGVTPIGFGGYARAMTAGPDGNVWLTHSSRSSVIRMTPQGEIAEFNAPYPGGITVGPDGNIWFTAASGAICRISVVGDVVQFPLPRAPIGIVTGPDGNLWFTEFDGTCHCPGGELPLPVAIGRPHRQVAR